MRKKLMALLLGACMVFSLAGCGEQAGGTNQEEEKQAAIENEKITINKYKGLEVEVSAVKEVTEEEVDASVKSSMAIFATENKEGVAKDGDVVVIDYVGKMDGVAFTGGTASDQTITIGAGGYIDGFEDGIIGHTVGETFDVPVKFPDSYHSADLQGKEAVFTMTLKGIAPEPTDEWVKKVSLVSTTVEEFREEHRAALENSNVQSFNYELEGEVWNALIEQCEVDEYPQDMLDAQYTALEKMFASVIGTYTLDDLVQAYYGITSEEYACNIVKQLLAVEAISEAESLTVTDEYYNAYLEEYAYSYGYDDLAEFETLVGKETLQQSCKNKIVGEFLVKNCVVTEK